MNDDLRWNAVGAAADWAPDSGRPVQIGVRRLGVYRWKDGWYALKDVCPHAGVSLVRGPLADGAVTCVGHGWRFRLDSGDLISGAGGFSVPTYPVRVRDGVVEVGL